MFQILGKSKFVTVNKSNTDHDSRTVDALIFDIFTLIARIFEVPNNSGILRGFNYRMLLRSSPKRVPFPN